MESGGCKISKFNTPAKTNTKISIKHNGLYQTECDSVIVDHRASDDMTASEDWGAAM